MDTSDISGADGGDSEAQRSASVKTIQRRVIIEDIDECTYQGDLDMLQHGCLGEGEICRNTGLKELLFEIACNQIIFTWIHG